MDSKILLYEHCGKQMIGKHVLYSDLSSSEISRLKAKMSYLCPDTEEEEMFKQFIIIDKPSYINFELSFVNDSSSLATIKQKLEPLIFSSMYGNTDQKPYYIYHINSISMCSEYVSDSRIINAYNDMVTC